MTNPLDLPGPEFLKFFFPYGIAVFLLTAILRFFWTQWSRRTAPVAPAPARWRPGIYPTEADAPAIALLRGGPQEVGRTILGRLVAEGFLTLNGVMMRASLVRDRARLAPLDEVALQAVSAAAGSREIAAREGLNRAVKELEPRLQPLASELEAAGLAPGAGQRQGYRFLGFAAMLLVTGLGTAKLLVALSRGRNNVQFLIVLLVVSVISALGLMKPPRQTAAGERYLAWLRKSHQPLAKMLSDGKRQSFGELALVAGIFGLASQPLLSPLQTALTPPQATGGGSGCSSGSSCSGGSSCSSGCGGGGGCGGCGG